MQNVKYEVRDGKLYIECDLAVDLGPSGSGKNIMVATSKGIKPVPGGPAGLQLGFNLFKAPPAK